MQKSVQAADADVQAPLVLVVDDQHETAQAVADLLELAGYRTVLAYDGEAAVAACERYRPAAVVMDLHMPVVGGLVACTRIRRQHDGRAIRLVALTGSTEAQDKEAAELAGFDHYLAKPVMLSALLRVLPPVAATS